MSVKSAYGYNSNGSRRYASDHGKKELYSDESGSTGAGVSLHLHVDEEKAHGRSTMSRTLMPPSTAILTPKPLPRTLRKR